MPEINSEDVERVGLLEIVSSSKTGLKILSKEQLSRLYALVKEKTMLTIRKHEIQRKNYLKK